MTAVRELFHVGYIDAARLTSSGLVRQQELFGRMRAILARGSR